jgi:hypothetical protein
LIIPEEDSIQPALLNQINKLNKRNTHNLIKKNRSKKVKYSPKNEYFAIKSPLHISPSDVMQCLERNGIPLDGIQVDRIRKRKL